MVVDSLLGPSSYNFFYLLHCPAVLCSAANTLLELLDRLISGGSFLTDGMFECNIAHHRYLVVLYMLYKIRCNQMNPLYGALRVYRMC